MSNIEREYSLRVSCTPGETPEGQDYYWFNIWINDSKGNQRDTQLVLGRAEPFLEAIFNVNHNNPINTVTDREMFLEALEFIKRKFYADDDIAKEFTGLHFADKFPLEHYSMAYIAILAWINMSKEFMLQNKEILENEEAEYLDEVYINEFIDRILADETECVCDVNLYTHFRGKVTIADIEDPVAQKVIDEKVNSFVAAVNDFIFVSDEEMEDYKNYTELGDTLDMITEDMEDGDMIVVKKKLDEDDSDKGPIN